MTKLLITDRFTLKKYSSQVLRIIIFLCRVSVNDSITLKNHYSDLSDYIINMV